jgi:hypothetical protein
MTFELAPDDTLVVTLDGVADDGVMAFAGTTGTAQVRLWFSPKDADALMQVLDPLAARYGGPVK